MPAWSSGDAGTCCPRGNEQENVNERTAVVNPRPEPAGLSARVCEELHKGGYCGEIAVHEPFLHLTLHLCEAAERSHEVVI